MKTFMITEEQLQEIFENYIFRRRYANKSTGYDGMWTCGEVKECEKWLKLFNIDLSYERIQPMIYGTKEIKVFD